MGDPKGADDEGSFQFSEIVVLHVTVKKAGVLASAPERQFTGDVQHRGLTELPVWVAQDRELGQGGVIAGIGGAVSERAAMHASEEGIRRVDSCAGQVQGDRPEVSGLFDAFQLFEAGPKTSSW